MTTKYVRTSIVEIKRDKVAFNINDEKGRVIGFLITLFEVTWEVRPDAVSYYSDNPKFIARTSVTRNGMSFGATTNAVRGNTIDETIAKAETRRDNAKKRYTKKFS